MRGEPPRTALRMHAFLARSRANGPGTRAVIWTQGCSRRCRGCFNPGTHAHTDGVLIAVDTLAQGLAARAAGLNAIDGLTISGGEPMEQPEAVCALLLAVRRDTGLSTLLFTGYHWDEVVAHPLGVAILDCLDAILTGPYRIEQHLGSGLLGSANQTIHCLTERYTLDELMATPPTEAIITPTGEVIWSGVQDPAQPKGEGHPVCPTGMDQGRGVPRDPAMPHTQAAISQSVDS